MHAGAGDSQGFAHLQVAKRFWERRELIVVQPAAREEEQGEATQRHTYMAGEGHHLDTMWGEMVGICMQQVSAIQVRRKEIWHASHTSHVGYCRCGRVTKTGVVAHRRRYKEDVAAHNKDAAYRYPEGTKQASLLISMYE